MTTTEIPVASTTPAEPLDNGCCWVLRDQDGNEFDPNDIGTFDSDAHFRKWADARSHADRVGEDVGEIVLTRLDNPCVNIACRVCETVLDEEGENYICHFDDIEAARAAANGYGWTIAADGTAVCGAEDCIDDDQTPASWADWVWPDWVPEKIRAEVEQFWSEKYGRSPRTWVRDMHAQGAPAFGAVVTLDDGFGPDRLPVTGRYVHAWNNIGRVVRDDGTYAYTSFSRRLPTSKD